MLFYKCFLEFVFESTISTLTRQVIVLTRHVVFTIHILSYSLIRRLYIIDLKHLYKMKYIVRVTWLLL